MLPPIAPMTRIAKLKLACRYVVGTAVMVVCAWTFVNLLVLEEFQVPTGSMAPALKGRHRVCSCPRCGHSVTVGRHEADTHGSGDVRFYRRTFCPNCGQLPLDLAATSEMPGDRVVVNTATYWMRAPARWEIVVLRLFGSYYIKRLLGLPDEEIAIHAGDLYVNRQLARKTFAQAKQMRVLVFDQSNALATVASRNRWTYHSPTTNERGGAVSATWTYQNVSFDTGKCEPIRDEYAYNAGVHANSECVHDFSVEAEVAITSGSGSIVLRLCDGHDWVEVRLPCGVNRSSDVYTWAVDQLASKRALSGSKKTMTLRAGQDYRIEFAFLDRRLMLAIDGEVFDEIDLPEAKTRAGVERPFQMIAAGARVELKSFRLYRDVHYGQQGRQAVHGKMVRLGVDQYFLLGDNSPHSEDSRHWPDEGRVSGKSLIGPLLWLR